MNGDIDLSSLSFNQVTHGLSRFLHRFHVVLFALIVMGGLAVATFMLYNTVTSTSADDPATAATSSFDQQTIQKVQSLRTADEESQPLQLSGRTNPFK